MYKIDTLFGEVNCKEAEIAEGVNGVVLFDEDEDRLGSMIDKSLPDDADEEVIFINEVETWLIDNDKV